MSFFMTMLELISRELMMLSQLGVCQEDRGIQERSNLEWTELDLDLMENQFMGLMEKC